MSVLRQDSSHKYRLLVVVSKSTCIVLADIIQDLWENHSLVE